MRNIPYFHHLNKYAMILNEIFTCMSVAQWFSMCYIYVDYGHVFQIMLKPTKYQYFRVDAWTVDKFSFDRGSRIVATTDEILTFWLRRPGRQRVHPRSWTAKCNPREYQHFDFVACAVFVCGRRPRNGIKTKEILKTWIPRPGRRRVQPRPRIEQCS